MRTLDSLPTWILSSASTRSHQVLHKRLAEAGTTGYEYRCLAALAVTDHLSQTQLSEVAVLDPRDVTHTVRALEGRGLVTRERDATHGRRLLVSLTKAGRQAARGLASVMEQVQDEVFGRLDSAERALLLGLLTRVG